MSNVDFLIFAPLDEELKALCNVFEITEPESLEDGTESYFTTVHTKVGPATAMIIHLHNMGALGAGVMTSKLIPKVHPLAVISFGIAGGFVGNDIRKKDVFIPAQILYYEPAKEIAGIKQSRALPFNTSIQLLVYARRAKRKIKQAIDANCIVGGKGPLASGEKKIADLDGPTVRLVKIIHSGTLAIEMEAAGVGAAVASWPEARPVPHFLAIKGISDDCSQVDNPDEKSELHEIDRNQAAKNAAFALKLLISESTLKRDDTSSECIEALKKRANDFRKVVPRFLQKKRLKDPEVEKILYPADSLPRIFYHWRMTTENLHWVDFVHILAIRQIQDKVNAFPVQFLITDENMSEIEKNKLVKIMTAIFRGSASVSWYSDVVDNQAKYEEYAKSQGFDAAVFETILDTRHRMDLREGNLISAEWLQYIVWACQDTRRGIVFVWDQMGTIYKQLVDVVSTQSFLIVRGADFRLAGSLGKFDQPGRDIIVDPPDYQGFMNAVLNISDGQAIKDLGYYLRLGEQRPPIGETLRRRLLKEFPQLDLDSVNVENQDEILSIVQCCSRWNKAWFNKKNA